MEGFSHFFSQKISDIRDKLDGLVTEENSIPHYKTVLPLPESKATCLFASFRLMTVEEISKIILSSPPKSSILDPIPTWLLKTVINSVAPTLTDIVNRSLQEGHSPADMKKALVTPLLKKPTLDKEILKNYRPVSNLSFVSKIIEKAAMLQISQHVSANNLLTKVQSAYRPLHSTETALLRVQNDILRSLDSSNGVILCLLDLSAAFDTIDHKILLSRLQNSLGIEGSALLWFQSYLEDRYQSIHINGVFSKPHLLSYGIPQGSVSGPQDFSYYTTLLADIAESHGISVHLYADDTQLYICFDLASLESSEEAVKKIEDCIQDIRIWMIQNKLKLNDDKTELLIILPSRQIHKCSISSIQVGETQVQSSKAARNLGVLFDDTMSMRQQVNSIVRNCYAQIRSIGQIRKYLSFDAAQSLIHAFITSRIDNGNSLLARLPDTIIDKIQRVQNTSARILTRTPKFQHITPVLKELHWLPVKKRIEFKILLLTYKCLNNLAPEYLTELIEIHQPTRTLRSSNSLNLVVPNTRLKTYGDRSFSKIAPVLWNPLPDHIKTSSSLKTFKSQLKGHIFKTCYS